MTTNTDRCRDDAQADKCFFVRLMVKVELERSNAR